MNAYNIYENGKQLLTINTSNFYFLCVVFINKCFSNGVARDL